MSKPLSCDERMPDGYELVPVGNRLGEHALVALGVPALGSRAWRPVLNKFAKMRVRANQYGAFPYGYYCRPIASAADVEVEDTP